MNPNPFMKIWTLLLIFVNLFFWRLKLNFERIIFFSLIVIPMENAFKPSVFDGE